MLSCFPSSCLFPLSAGGCSPLSAQQLCSSAWGEAEWKQDRHLVNAQVAPGQKRLQRYQPPGAGADGCKGPGASASFTRAWSCFLLCSICLAFIEILNCSIFPTELCSVRSFRSCAAVALSLCEALFNSSWDCFPPCAQLQLIPCFFPSRQRIHRQSGSTKTGRNCQTSDWRANKLPRLSIAGAS